MSNHNNNNNNKLDEWDSLINEAIDSKKELDESLIEGDSGDDNNNLEENIDQSGRGSMLIIGIVGIIIVGYGITFNNFVIAVLISMIGFSISAYGFNSFSNWDNIKKKESLEKERTIHISCSNCEKTVYISKAQKKYFEDGGEIECPHCLLPFKKQ
jgi:DNA-directed RNA polymerase subunit RPC12/RpoP